MTSPLWIVRLRYCVFSTMLHSNTEIIEVARRCVLLRSCILINSVLPPSHWANCLRYCVQLQHETTVFVWEINMIQSKIKIHKHVNLSWHKILKNDCARGWRCTWVWKCTVICIFGSERFKRIYFKSHEKMIWISWISHEKHIFQAKVTKSRAKT